MARRGGSVWLREHYGPGCRPELVQVTIGSGVARGFDSRTVEAWQAYAAVIAAHGYHTRAADTGVYVCRNTASGFPSPHSWGTALDHNWTTNPATGGVYGGPNRIITDMPAAMVADLKAIRTVEGLAVFSWGGDYSSFKDAMHWEIRLTPAELARGIDWTTVSQTEPDPADPTTWPTLREGDRGPTVAKLQVRLIDDALIHVEGGPDGRFGTGTIAAVLEFQESRGLTVDGVFGLQSWTALLAGMPALAPGDAGPVKDQPTVPDLAVAVRYAPGSNADNRIAHVLGAGLVAHVAPITAEQTVGTVYLIGGPAVRGYDRTRADTVIEVAGPDRQATLAQVMSIVSATITPME